MDGVVTGVRFYKSAANTGAHTGSLWSDTGTLLATASFGAETASGWQTVTFSQPVAVTAGATYVASYHTTTGHYSEDDHYFGAGLINGPLTVPADGVAGANGVYAVGASAFPNQTFVSANYWVDIVFNTAG